LNLGQMSIGFEITPTGLVCRLNHQFILSTGKWYLYRSTGFARSVREQIPTAEDTLASHTDGQMTTGLASTDRCSARGIRNSGQIGTP
jgi:hypothetical protein